MISYLRGKVILKEDRFIVIDVGGIGFKVFLASSKIESIIGGEKIVSLFCSLKARKDSWDLYGFFSSKELELFDFLMNVSGIGPKAAMEISSIGSLNNLKEGIKNGDQKIMEELFKIGRKKAQAIIFEISRELKNQPEKDSKTDEEASRALLKLGFLKKEIKNVLSGLPEKLSVEEKVEKALKEIGKR